MRSSLSLSRAAREYVWLWDNRHGMSPRQIADRDEVNVRRVQDGIARAREMERPDERPVAPGTVRGPRLIPLFPVTTYTPQSTCAHKRALRVGSLFCCMVCHRTGIDGHPALQRNPATDPKPEPKPAAPPKPKKARETRKEARARRFAKLSVVSCQLSVAKNEPQPRDPPSITTDN